MRDDPSAISQVRSMLNVKQQQKALIEQRRGSNAGLSGVASPMTGPAAHVVNAPEPRHFARRSPPISGATNARRMATSAGVRSASPPSTKISSESNSHTPVTNVLPQPPISFAHRRASRLGAKSKPADILISPRDVQSSEQMQPSIMSAPPISGAAPGRFAMALPSLPQTVVSGQTITRLTSSIVPPTPTRLGGPRTAIPSLPGPQISVTGRSPPAASVPISAALVPPTPSSLHRPSYASEKSAFLAPFESFYDALADSKQLKTWLGEQLQKSNGLIGSLQKCDNIEGLVEALVEKKVVGLREEMYTLRRRVEELETALRASQEFSKGKGRAMDCTPDVPEPYTFPPVPAPPRNSHYTNGTTPPARTDANTPGSQTNSPIPLERKHSISSSRFDSRPEPPNIERSQHHNGAREGAFQQLISSNPSKNNRLPAVSRTIHPSHSSSNAHSPPLSAHKKSGQMENHREAPDDLNIGEKRSGIRSNNSRGAAPPYASRHRSNSSGESS